MASYEGVGTILGGLPIIAKVAFGKDADGPWGYGEYWSEVEAIYWVKRNGTKGKEIPQHIFDRAEKYDPYFCSLTEHLSECAAHEAAEAKDRRDDLTFLDP